MTPKEIVLDVLNTAPANANPKSILNAIKERGLDVKTINEVLRVELGIELSNEQGR